MRKSLLLSLLVTGFFAKAQNIEVPNNALNFADATELSSTTQDLVINNPGIYPIDVVDIDLFEIYSDVPFSVSDTAFTISPQDSHTVTVSFLPGHNIDHQMGLVIKTSSGFGHVAVTLAGKGEYSNSYYSSTQNQTGAALRTALSNRISQNYNQLSYSVARDNMYASIDNENGDVTCVYTGQTATFNTRAGANNNNFNCEHTFPQGHFNQNLPMRSDIHHLFPTIVQANSRRGNDPFGVVNNASWSQGGSKSGNGKFEPRDEQKGATARAMMYFVLRYQDYQNFFQGQQNILYQWHEEFLPDADEKQRNDEIYALQNNRNPFVDYPQFKERMGSLTGNAAVPTFQELYLSDDTIKLARLAGRYVYEFVVYNEGNTNITLNNFALSDTGLSFDQGMPTNLVIGPHQSESLRIAFHSSTDYQGESLSFDTDVPGMSNVTVPIYSGTSIGIDEPEMAAEFDVYPNPANDFVTISGKLEDIEKVWVTNVSGMAHAGMPDDNGITVSEAGRVDISELAGGVYILSIETENGARYSERIVVVRK